MFKLLFVKALPRSDLSNRLQKINNSASKFLAKAVVERL